MSKFIEIKNMMKYGLTEKAIKNESKFINADKNVKFYSSYLFSQRVYNEIYEKEIIEEKIKSAIKYMELKYGLKNE